MEAKRRHLGTGAAALVGGQVAVCAFPLSVQAVRASWASGGARLSVRGERAVSGRLRTGAAGVDGRVPSLRRHLPQYRSGQSARGGWSRAADRLRIGHPLAGERHRRRCGEGVSHHVPTRLAVLPLRGARRSQSSYASSARRSDVAALGRLRAVPSSRSIRFGRATGPRRLCAGFDLGRQGARAGLRLRERQTGGHAGPPRLRRDCLRHRPDPLASLESLVAAGTAAKGGLELRSHTRRSVGRGSLRRCAVPPGHLHARGSGVPRHARGLAPCRQGWRPGDRELLQSPVHVRRGDRGGGEADHSRQRPLRHNLRVWEADARRPAASGSASSRVGVAPRVRPRRIRRGAPGRGRHGRLGTLRACFGSCRVRTASAATAGRRRHFAYQGVCHGR